MGRPAQAKPKDTSPQGNKPLKTARWVAMAIHGPVVRLAIGVVVTLALVLVSLWPRVSGSSSRTGASEKAGAAGMQMAPTAQQKAKAAAEHARAAGAAGSSTAKTARTPMTPTAQQRTQAAAERVRALALAKQDRRAKRRRKAAPAAAATAGGALAADPQARQATYEQIKRKVAEANQLRQEYNEMMTKNPVFDDTSKLKQAVNTLLEVEKQIIATYASATGQMELSLDQLKLFMDVVDAIASVYDDLNDSAHAVTYFHKLIEYDRCNLVRQTNATLEYEYCNGRFYSRLIIMYRHELNRPDLAEKVYQQAVAKKFNNERVHWWPNQYQVPTMFMKGLRSMPFWEGQHKLPIAQFLEDNYKTIKAEFNAMLNHPTYGNVFTQNDHTLLTQGSWGELKLFDGKVWKPPCHDVAPLTCQLLYSRPELMGKFPNPPHNVQLPKESGYFKLRPGTHLKAHTGPINFHLYCHLGLQVPEGPRLRVGDSEPRKWEEGKVMCFDDSYDHEAWHDGTEDRYVLMITFWHPDLGVPQVNPEAPVPPSKAKGRKQGPKA
eukprot:gnl/TRDRNA2_/TRDRNA2_180253_c0_seq1.p1 gnl/TRDRNA2_/TRDRNA2_180253_c0~~gnl/TRDRNA2_/TRDRNA2_180253_c0_seq1.p1  ORF type:complete len:549 (-),score=107.05 gnl/TRDRNA2_/TRDRNA2_180253_c0_seq1:131-1777(-)